MREHNPTIQIFGSSVGDNAPCFITFEAGPTHQGLQSAKRLARYAQESGGNAITAPKKLKAPVVPAQE